MANKFFGKLKSGAKSMMEHSEVLENRRMRSKIRELQKENALLYQKLGEAIFRSPDGKLRGAFPSIVAEIEQNYEKASALYLRLSELPDPEELEAGEEPAEEEPGKEREEEDGGEQNPGY